MRTLIALAVLCAPAFAAPVPKELRKPPVEKEASALEKSRAELNVELKIALMNGWAVKSLPLKNIKPVNGTTTPMK